MEKKLVQFQVSIDNVEIRAEDWKVIIEGYASTPDIDRYNSIITTEAIAGGMENYLKNPVILLGHDMDKPIGKMVSYNVENGGLRIKAEVSQDTDGIIKQIKDWVVKGFSIWFYALAWSYETKQGVPLSALSETEIDELSYDDVIRKITKIELLEISVVALPANPNALFTLTRALKDFFEKHEKRSVMKNVRDLENMDKSDNVDDEKENIEEWENWEDKSDEVVENEEEKENEEEQGEIEGVAPANDDKQGDEGEVAGENPEPQKEAEDPNGSVESTDEAMEQLHAKIELLEDEKVTLKSEVESLQTRLLDAIDLAERLQKIVESKTVKIGNLQRILDKIPSKRWLVYSSKEDDKQDALMGELISAKSNSANL